MKIPANHLVQLVDDQTAGATVFTSADARRGRCIKVSAQVGQVVVGGDRSADAVEGPAPGVWDEGNVPLDEERLDMLIDALLAARLQAFGKFGSRS